jgi:hypothetical protein
MLEKIIVLLISYSLSLAVDIRSVLVKPELPDIHLLVDLTLTRPAKMIVEFLTVRPT